MSVISAHSHVNREIRLHFGWGQSFQHPCQGGWLPATTFPCQNTGQLTHTDKGGVVLHFAFQDLCRMFSLSYKRRRRRKRRNQNRLSISNNWLEKKKIRIQCFLEKLAGSTAPPSGRFPWSNNQLNERQELLLTGFTSLLYSHHWIFSLSSASSSSSGKCWYHLHFTDEVQWLKQGHTSHNHQELGNIPSHLLLVYA